MGVAEAKCEYWVTTRADSCGYAITFTAPERNAKHSQPRNHSAGYRCYYEMLFFVPRFCRSVRFGEKNKHSSKENRDFSVVSKYRLKWEHAKRWEKVAIYKFLLDILEKE